jgi:UDP-2,3-diacylglucosamine pyrophosphatase LpxH
MSKNRDVSWLAFSCLHAPLHDPEAVAWLVELIAAKQPDVIVNMGDGHEMGWASRFDDDSEIDALEEYKAHNEIMREIRQAAPEARRVFLPGNHEWRLYSNTVPEQIRTALHWKTHEPELRDHWEHPVDYLNCRHRGVFRLGQVVFSHGFAVSASSVKKETCTLAREWGLYVHGHTHRATQPGPPERIQMTTSWLANWWRANPGCLRDLKPGYMSQLDSTLWTQGAVWGHAQLIKSPRAKRCWEATTEIFRTYDQWSAGR